MQALLAGAVSSTECDVVVCFKDYPSLQPREFLPSSKVMVTTGATAIDICDAPSNTTVREVDFISFRNNDSASVTVTFRYVEVSTNYKIAAFTLATLEALFFTADKGWQCMDASGNLKNVIAGNIAATDLFVSGNTTLGDASGDAVTINAATLSIPNGLNVDSNTFVIDATNNRVGVGTATPSSPFHVSTALNAEVRITANTIVNADWGLLAQTGNTTPLFRIFNRTQSLDRITVDANGVANVLASTATPAGGSTSARLLFGTTAGFGIYIGSGAPTVSAGQGSLYLRSDGSSTTDRAYINTNGSTTWTALTTVA